MWINDEGSWPFPFERIKLDAMKLIGFCLSEIGRVLLGKTSYAYRPIIDEERIHIYTYTHNDSLRIYVTFIHLRSLLMNEYTNWELANPSTSNISQSSCNHSFVCILWSKNAEIISTNIARNYFYPFNIKQSEINIWNKKLYSSWIDNYSLCLAFAT